MEPTARFDQAMGASAAGTEPEAHGEGIVIERYGVAFGERVILADVSFSAPRRGALVIMGPAGTGKSTLLRSLAGLNSTNPRYRAWGRVRIDTVPPSDDNAPTLILQNSKLLEGTVFEHLAQKLRTKDRPAVGELRARVQEELTRLERGDILQVLDRPVIDLPAHDQRCVAILGGAVAGAGILMVDEPTAGLSDFASHIVLDLMTRISESRTLITVLHNQRHAKAMGGRLVLLAGGRVQANQDVQEFLEAPAGPVAAQFVRTGSCSVPSPDASAETLADDVPAPPPLPVIAQIAKEAVPEYRGPRGFRWIIPGKLGTTPLPGAVVALEHDLAALRTVGATVLVSLTRVELPRDKLQQFGLKDLHLPIYDREAPTTAQLKMLSIRMSDAIHRGEVLVVHCRAGLGRTGTIVAGWLIREGLTAKTALERIRLIDKDYVQTDVQEKFLYSFEQALLADL